MVDIIDRKTAKRVRFTLAIPLALTVISPSFGATELEEIVVTAQRRSENLQDVPIAMAAFTGHDINQLAVDDLRQLIEYIPGVELFDDRGISSQPTWIIRGVGLADFNANNTPTAAIYYDEFYLTSNIMGGIGLFDIERIEVLKGPQGGLYGRNTTGGAIIVESVKPSTADSDNYIAGSVESYGAINAEAAFSGAVTENVGFRIAAKINRGGGYQDTLASLFDDNWGDRDIWAVRAQMLFDPSDAVSILLKVEAGEDQSEVPLGHGIGVYDDAGNLCPAIVSGRQDDENCLHWANITNLALGHAIGPLPSDQSQNGKLVTSNPINTMDNDWLSGTARIDWDLENLTFTSISAFIDYTNRQPFDYDGSFLDTGHEFNHSPVESWSQEFRLISKSDATLTWLAGLMYAEDTLDEFRTFTFTDNFLIFGGIPSSDRGFEQETDAWSAFLQLGYDLNEQWKIHGSIRFTDEDKTLRGGYTTLNEIAGEPGVTPGVPLFYVIEDVDKDYSLEEKWSGYIGIDWKPSDRSLLYGRISRGVKSGGFSGGFGFSPDDLNPYLEESVTSYEIGFKSDLVNNSLRLNTAFYYYDYSNVQGFISVFNEFSETVTGFLGNIGDARHLGGELDIMWILSDGFILNGGVALLDAELQSDKSFLSQDAVTLVPYDGLKRPYAPELSYFIQGRYEWTIGDQLVGGIQVNYSWRDQQVHEGTTGNAVNTGLFAIGSYGLLNGRIQIGKIDNQWSIAFFGKNLTDEKYLANTTWDGIGGYVNTFGRPRTLGIEARYNWQ